MIVTHENEEVYDKLRQSLLALLSQQRLEKRREQEKRNLEEKLKKIRQ